MGRQRRKWFIPPSAARVFGAGLTPLADYEGLLNLDDGGGTGSEHWGPYTGAAGFAALFDLLPADTTAQALAGIDSDNSGDPLAPYLDYEIGGDVQFGGDDWDEDYAASRDVRMVVQRSDTHGHLAFLNAAPNKWRLIGVDPDTATQGTAYVALTDASTNFTKTQVAALDLSGVAGFSGDFAEVTDTETAPSTGTNFDCTADCHVTGTVTVEDTKYVYVYIRYTDANNWVRMSIDTSRVLKIEKNVATVTSTVATGSTLTDSQEYQFDIVASGEDITVTIDQLPDASGTASEHTSVAQGRVEHDLATNDLDVTSHPLTTGHADDFVVCPDHDGTGRPNSKTSGAPGYVFIIRNVQGTSGSQIVTWITGDTDAVSVRLTMSTGLFRMYQGAGLRGSVAAAVAPGDTIIATVHPSEASTHKAFVNGANILDALSMTACPSTTWGWNGNDLVTCDLVEAWPLYVTMPFAV